MNKLYRLTLIKQTLLSASLISIASACGGGSDEQSEVGVLTSAQNPSSLIIETFKASEAVLTPNIPTEGCDNNTTDESKAFNDVSKSAGLCYETSKTPEDSTASRVAGGIAVNDYNSDGLLDIYVTHGRNTSGKLLSLNNDNSFSDVTEQAGISVQSTDHGGIFFDINNDGYTDLISVQEAPSLLQVFANLGDGTFSEITDSTGLNLTKVAYTIAAGDHDLDGDLDLMFAHWRPDEEQNSREYLWQNQGDATFQDISEMIEIGKFEAGSEGQEPVNEFEYSFTPIFADINNDQYPDLLVASDWGSSQTFINNGGTALTNTTTFTINDRAGMGAAVADYDNDGDLDWFVSSIGDTREQFLRVGLFDGNRLYQNDGMGNFTNVTDTAGVRQGYWGWGSCFADFNSDGYEDLFIVNGFDGMSEDDPNRQTYIPFIVDRAVLYINNQDGTFTERGVELGITHTAMGKGLACYDYDRDGDLDMLIANNGESPSLFRNNNFSENNNFLNIRLKGLAKNPQAVGAKIYITIDGKTQVRELQLGNNYVSQNPVEAHFGLGASQIVSKIRIVWPGLTAGENELVEIEANQFLLIHQPEF
ncbi:MAG: hypothetical protein ACJAS9_000007 [Polaribacter sp.]|jgi:hypothetical protein